MSEGVTAYLQKLGERPDHDLRETLAVRKAEALPRENACQAILDGETNLGDVAVADL
jgi:hypothetical protein